jgi:hypothetical protein
MTYRAIVAVPPDLHLEITCPEFPLFHSSVPDGRGRTGLRFALLAGHLIEGAEAEGILQRGEPLTPDQHAEIVRRSEDPRWDPHFPNHPLSRVRSYLAEIGALA